MSEENKYAIFELDDTKYETQLTNKFANRKKYAPKNPKIATAYIPGSITEIFVKVGQAVAKDETMLILEAMKMKNKVKAPIDGKIKTITVKVGDKVSKNQLLVEIE